MEQVWNGFQVLHLMVWNGGVWNGIRGLDPELWIGVWMMCARACSAPFILSGSQINTAKAEVSHLDLSSLKAKTSILKLHNPRPSP